MEFLKVGLHLILPLDVLKNIFWYVLILYPIYL